MFRLDTLGQASFNTPSYTETEFYSYAELMKEAKEKESQGKNLRVVHQEENNNDSTLKGRSKTRKRLKSSECQGRMGSLYLLTQGSHLKPQSLK